MDYRNSAFCLQLMVHSEKTAAFISEKTRRKYCWESLDLLNKLPIDGSGSKDRPWKYASKIEMSFLSCSIMEVFFRNHL